MSGSAGHDRGRRALALGVGVALAMVYLAGAALDATSPGPRHVRRAGAAPTRPDARGAGERQAARWF
jgi:hypothetical protein